MAVVEMEYQPRPAMVKFHHRLVRYAILVCHRGFGKTVAVVQDLIMRATSGPVDAKYAYIAPYRVQAKAIAWGYLKKFCWDITGRVFNEADLSVTLPGNRTIVLYGADNPDSLRGQHFHGIVIDETEQITDKLYDDVLSQTLLAAYTKWLECPIGPPAGWTTWIGTIKGTRGLWKMWNEHRQDDKYFTCYIRASESGVFPQQALDEEKEKNPVKYAREMELDPLSEVSGAIYGKQMAALSTSTRITFSLAMDEGVPLYTFWDLGMHDFTCIWLLQFVGRDILALDYYCQNGQLASHYVDKMGVWERKWGKPISTHFLPHDARSQTGGALGWEGELNKAGMKNTETVDRTKDEWLGINVLRGLLPRFYFHQRNCDEGWNRDGFEMPSGLDCLRYYHSKETTTEGMFKVAFDPVHDQYSHGCDALRTFSEAYQAGQIPGTSSYTKSLLHKTKDQIGWQTNAWDRNR